VLHSRIRKHVSCQHKESLKSLAYTHTKNTWNVFSSANIASSSAYFSYCALLHFLSKNRIVFLAYQAHSKQYNIKYELPYDKARHLITTVEGVSMAEEDKKDEKEPEEGAPKEGGEAAAEGDEEAAKKKKKKKKLIIIVVAAVVLLGGGGAGVVLSGVLKKKPVVVEGEHAEGVEPGKEPIVNADGKVEEIVYYDMQEFIVNLNVGSKTPSFLKMTVSLELPGESQIPMIEAKMPRVRDTFQVYLRELRPSDLSGSAGMYRLREELLLRINKTVYPARVNDILFKEILVQ